jgi:hypothetical protein
MWDNALQMGVFLVWVPPSIFKKKNIATGNDFHYPWLIGNDAHCWFFIGSIN